MYWTTTERPGYLGKKRDAVQQQWNDKYGEGNWRIAYQWGTQAVDKRMGIQIYEDGYVDHFKRNPEDLEWITALASDVYDTAPSNVASGLDYDRQETPNNHIHDIAIRRAVLRSGTWFQGNRLVHVRWTDSEGFRLNPGIVLFHKPELILPGNIQDYGGKGLWWDANSIEDFYQRNKILQVRSHISL
jgi:hypothetical protein